MTNVNDIPKELFDNLKKMFESEPRVQQLRVQQQMFMKSMKYREALAIAQDIDLLFNKVVYEYIEESRQQVEQVEVAKLDMPDADKEELMKMLLVCFMCADMIESSVIRMNDILHKYDKNMFIETFDDIRQAMKMSEEKLKYLQENSGYMEDLVWADTCDDIYKMVVNKAGAIMRKRKTDPNYGKGRGAIQKYVK